MPNTSTTMLHIPFSKDLAALLGAQPQAVERARELIILGLYYFRLTSDEWAEEVAAVKAWTLKRTNGQKRTLLERMRIKSVSICLSAGIR